MSGEFLGQRDMPHLVGYIGIVLFWRFFTILILGDEFNGIQGGESFLHVFIDIFLVNKLGLVAVDIKPDELYWN